MHEPSRRSMLGAGLGLIGLVVVGVDESVAEAAAAPAPVRNDYSRAVHRMFTVKHGGRTHHLKLTAVHDLPHASRAHGQSCFSLSFTPTGHAVLPDGIYRLKRAGVRTHSLFLARIGTGRTLQAVVNRAH